MKRGTITNAYENMTELVFEANLPPDCWTREVEATELPDIFVFRVTGPNGTHHIIEMPGFPLKHLKDEHTIVPRIYVDGNSWWWRYAVDALKR